MRLQDKAGQALEGCSHSICLRLIGWDTAGEAYSKHAPFIFFSKLRLSCTYGVLVPRNMYSRQPGFEYCFQYFVAVWLWTCYWTSLNLHFFIWKTGMKVITRFAVKSHGNDVWEGLSVVPPRRCSYDHDCPESYYKEQTSPSENSNKNSPHSDPPQQIWFLPTVPRTGYVGSEKTPMRRYVSSISKGWQGLFSRWTREVGTPRSMAQHKQGHRGLTELAICAHLNSVAFWDKAIAIRLLLGPQESEAGYYMPHHSPPCFSPWNVCVSDVTP